MDAFVCLFLVFDSGILSVCFFLNGLMILLLFWTFHSVLRVNGVTFQVSCTVLNELGRN